MQFALITSTALSLIIGFGRAVPASSLSTSTKSASTTIDSATASGPTYNPTSPPVLKSGGYISTCDGVTLIHDTQGYFLQADCQEDNHNTILSNLHLGDCIGNDSGQLIYEKGGSFGNSCMAVDLRNPYTLEAQCANGRGSFEKTRINLNSLIGNNDGQLIC